MFPVILHRGRGAGGQTTDTEPHRPGPREVHAVRQALPHLVAEEAGADALQVLRRDLQRGREDGGGERRSRPGWGAPARKLPLRGSLPGAEAKLTLSSELSGFQALSPTEKTAPVTPGLMVGIAL